MRSVAAAGLAPRCVKKRIEELSRTITGTGGGVIVNDDDVTPLRPADVKASVRSPAVPEIERLLKAAMPAVAATVAVPANVPPPAAIDAVTDAVEVVTTLPAASRISMTGCVPSA